MEAIRTPFGRGWLVLFLFQTKMCFIVGFSIHLALPTCFFSLLMLANPISFNGSVVSFTT